MLGVVSVCDTTVEKEKIEKGDQSCELSS